MKISLNWLKDYVDIEMSPHELSRLLTMLGLEVDGVVEVGRSLDDIIAAKILTIAPHPKAGNLSLCEVDTGHETVPVVCGAPNLEKDSIVPLAVSGTRLPDGTIIKETEIRGYISKGILLAEDELGLTDDHSGIMILPEDTTPGRPLPSILPIYDWVIDLEITPNRPDCASVLGVAREIAASTRQRLKRPDIKITETGPPIDKLARVAIMEPDGCPRYAAGIIQGVEIGPSPFWMRYRLYLSGIRSINNVVDVTNYVMLETGQPLHAFDYNRLKGNRIVVRLAKKDETFTTLDGENHILNEETLLICDSERPVALAGIMGGLNSEIFAGSRDVLVESAFFHPVTIRKASKRLGILTEASYRFERETDIEGVTTALIRAIYLMHRLSGGEIASGIIDNYPRRYKPRIIDLRVDRTNRILGSDLSRDSISGYLASLEMEVKDVSKNRLRITPPSFRVDISREADLIEEIARLSGYEDIPVTIPSIRPTDEQESPELVLRNQIRSIMMGIGFTEIITYGFISPDWADILNADEGSPVRSFVKLINPLTVDQSVMRTSLIPGLLSTIKTNITHGETDLRLFETGKIFIRKPGDQQPYEKLTLSAIITGLSQKKSWYNSEERAADFFDIKGAVEALLRGLGLEDCSFKREKIAPWYDPDIMANIKYSGSQLGQVGRISQEVMKSYGLKDNNVYLFELDMESLLPHLSKGKKFRPFAKFPAVYRDISLIVNRKTESATILDIIQKEGGDLVESVRIFDLYEGDKIDALEKAIAFKLCYRSKNTTLDGTEVNRIHGRIIDKIRQETGGRLREG